MWVAQHFRWRHPRTMISSGGLGTMGFGLPAAIGAKVARPDALVIDIDGDASFAMTESDLSTASRFNIGVKVIVLNNEEQGMVTQWQNLFYEDRYSHTHQKNDDFMMLATAKGVQCRRVSKPEELVESLRWLIESDGPAFLEVVTDKKVPVLPMVPTGSGLHEFITWDAGKFFPPSSATACFADGPCSQGEEEEGGDARTDRGPARLIGAVSCRVDDSWILRKHLPQAARRGGGKSFEFGTTWILELTGAMSGM